MKLADVLRMLLRRWYIVVVGIVVAVGAAYLVWDNVAPGYQRTTSQLLLPGELSIPEGGNPYLYIAGLSQAADVLALALGADGALEEITAEHPGAQIEVLRDYSTAGPVVSITVVGATDTEAELLLNGMIERTAFMLDDIQAKAGVAADNRISVLPLSVDAASTLEQRDRMTLTAAASVAIVVLSLVLAGLIDGLSMRRRRAGRAGAARRAVERKSRRAESAARARTSKRRVDALGVDSDTE